MNGKVSKMLRKLITVGVTKKDKREFNNLTQHEKSMLRGEFQSTNFK